MSKDVILRFFVLGAVLLGSALQAAPAPDRLDYLVVGSKTYSNVTVLGANATDLFFTYEKGMSNAKLKYLEPAMQERFHYDPQAGAAAEQQQIEDEARYVALMSARMAADLAAQAEKALIAAKKAASTYEGSVVDPVSDESLLGKKAPALEVEKWLGEKPELKEKFLLVEFWAPWSFACRNAIPQLNALQKKFGEKLVVVGLTADHESEIEEMPGPKIAFPAAIDSQARTISASGVASIPSVLLVDPKGIVRYQGHPGVLSEKVVEMLLAKFAEEPTK